MNKRKVFLIAGGICLLAAAGLFIAKTQYEAKLRGDIEAFLAGLPKPLTASAEKIDVSMFDKSIVLSNLKGRFEDGANELEFSTARVEAKGVNLDAFKPGAGTMELAKSVTFADTTAKGSGLSVAIESQTMENVVLDFTMFMDEYVKIFPDLVALYQTPELDRDEKAQKKILAACHGLLQAYETLSIGKYALRNYGYTVLEGGKKITMSIADCTGQDYSIREMGPSALTGLTVAMDGKNVMSWESLACDGMSLPSFVEFLKAVAGEEEPTPETITAALAGQVFALKNLRGKKLAFQDPGNPARKLFDLADFGFSYEARDAHAIDFSYSGFAIEKKLIRDKDDVPDEALALLPEILSFDGAFQGSATRKADTADADCKKLYLKAAGLGEFSLSFSVKDLDLLAAVLGTPGPAALKSLDASVTDTGASDFFFTVKAGGMGDTPADVRADLLDLITGIREMLPNESLKGLADALGTFLEKSGKTLKITVAPEKPVPLTLLQNPSPDALDMLGLTSSVTPDN